MELKTFNFDAAAVRVVADNDGEPWFVAADVAGALQYSEASAMTRSLDDDEKGLQIVQTPGGQQELAVINESGLYSAILKSRRPEAKRFKRWVTHDVLPTIRKTGAYVAHGATGDLFPGPPAQDPRIALLAGLKASGVLSSAGAEFASFRLLGLRPPQGLMRSAAPAASPAPASAQLELAPTPPAKLVPIKIIARRGPGAPAGMDLVLDEVADYCGVVLGALMYSMRSHGLIDDQGNPTARGRALVAFKKRGRSHWMVGALMRHLTA